MALVLKDRVKVTTTTTGTGTLTLGAASQGFQDFSVIGDGNSTYYTIQDPTTGAWEVGVGVYTASGTTLSRNVVLSSSNSGSLVDFAAGSKVVFVTYPAEKSSISYYTTVTSAYTAGFSEGVLANTTGGAFTVTLPASPYQGSQVSVSDSGGLFGTNNLTVGRNGSTISGLAQDLVLDISGVSVQFIYNGTTWLVYAQVGGNGGTVVTLNGVQTLTNKTISGANNTITNVSLSTGVTGILPVNNGGTGATSLTANNVLLGNGGAALQVVAPGASGNVLTSNGTTWTSAAASGAANIQTFTTSGTWTKPAGAQFVMVECWGAGGGGASGATGASATGRVGGPGGAGGAYVCKTFIASDLGSTVSVTIGAGGAGGTGVSASTTKGNNGGNGGNSTFGTHLTGYGGGYGTGPNTGAVSGTSGGGGGPTSAGNAATIGDPFGQGAAVSSIYGGGGGGTSVLGNSNGGGSVVGGGGGGGTTATTNVISGSGGSSAYGGAGGGGGGSITSGNLTAQPGAGGSSTGTYGGGGAAGTSGATATAGTAGTGRSGGGGGGSATGGNGGAGGAGGVAAGGGGGGSCINGFTSGAGGAGGSGLVRVYTW